MMTTQVIQGRSRSRFRGWRLAAGAVTLAALTGLAGCGDDTLTQGDNNTETQNVVARSNITGFVRDADGNALPDVPVTAAGQSTTTGPQGEYTLRDVPVTNVTGTDDGGMVGSPITVVADPGQGFLSGGAQVTPQAQIDNNTDDNLGTDGSLDGCGGTGGDGFSGSTGDGSTGGNGGSGDLDVDFDEGSATGGDGGGCSLSDSNGDGAITTVFQGMTFSAPIIIVAELNTTVSGTLRNERTGALITNQQVVLDYQGPDNSELAICATAGACSTLNAAPSFNLVATSGTDGTFSIMNAPENSCLRLFVPQHDNVSFTRSGGSTSDVEGPTDCDQDGETSPGEVSTANDGGFIVQLGTVLARPILASGDTTPPVVADFGGLLTIHGDGFVDVAEPSSGETDRPKRVGLIRENIDGTAGTPLVVTFSEPVPDSIIDGDAVLVRTAPDGDIGAGEYLTIASTSLSADGRTLTIVLDDSTPLPEGSEFAIYLAKNAFFDTSGLGLVFDNGMTFTENEVDNDFNRLPRFFTGGTDLENRAWVDFIVLCLKRVGNVNTDVDQVVANQVEIDPGTDNDSILENTVSAQFNDVLDGDGANVIWQLNDATDGSRTPGATGSDTEAREEALAEALLDASATVRDDVARVEWSPVPDANGYRVTVNGVANNDVFTVSNSGVVSGDSSDSTVEINANGDFAVVVENVRSGDTVTVTSLDDLGNPSNDPPSVVTLIDNTRISPVLQRSFQTLYDVADRQNHPVCGRTEFPVVVGADSGNAGVVLNDGSESLGEGGEGAGGENVAASVGAPCLGVSPELLIQPLNSEGAETPDDPAYLEAFASLQAGNPDAIGDAADIDGVTVFISDRWENRPAYDEDAFDDWGPQSRRMQIATSEDATIVNTPTTVDVSTALSDFQEQNNTVFGQLEAPLVGDGISFLVNDILNFANADDGGSIVLTDNITDANGNAADLDVNVKDQWPPMMTEARRETDGSLTFVFNEDVVVPTGATVYLLSGEQNVTATIASTDLDVTGNTITVDPTVVAALPAGVFGEGVYMDGGVDRSHFYVDSSEIEDTRGNKFEETSFDDSLGENGGIGETESCPTSDSPLFGAFPGGQNGEPCALDTYPVFVGVDLIGPFEISVTTTGFEAGSEMFNITYSSTHPIYLSAANASAGGCATNGAAVAVPGFLGDGVQDIGDFMFGGFVVDMFTPTNTTTTSVSFTVDVSGTLGSGDTLDSVNSATSQLLCPSVMPSDTINPPQQVAN